MNSAYYRSPVAPGTLVSIAAEQLLDKRLASFPTVQEYAFLCPSCGEQVILVRPNKTPGEKYYRPAHFKHQRAYLCETDDCDLRVDLLGTTAEYLTQRIRSPLFLRPCGEGRFSLAAGFISANKELLKTLRRRDYERLSIRMGESVKGSILLSDLIQEESITYVDLPCPIKSHANYRLDIDSKTGSRSAATVNSEWAERLDWFGDEACSGAIFEYGTGNAGEKIRAGGAIVGGRPYLIAEKMSWDNSEFVHYKETAFGKISRVKLGHLQFKDPHVPAYTIYKVQFPVSTAVSPEQYLSLVKHLQERFAVMLCDEILETRPVWPPAARRSDAYTSSPAFSKEAIVAVCGVDAGVSLYVHRDLVTPMPAPVFSHKEFQYTVLLLATKRAYLTAGWQLSSSVNSYRVFTQGVPPTPALAVIVDGTEVSLSASGDYPFRVSTNAVLVATTRATICTGLDTCVSVKAGEKFVWACQKDPSCVVRLDSGAVFRIFRDAPLMVVPEETSETARYVRKYDKYERIGGKYHG